jgi:hypothetical protein
LAWLHNLKARSWRKPDDIKRADLVINCESASRRGAVRYDSSIVDLLLCTNDLVGNIKGNDCDRWSSSRGGFKKLSDDRPLNLSSWIDRQIKSLRIESISSENVKMVMFRKTWMKRILRKWCM